MDQHRELLRPGRVVAASLALTLLLALLPGLRAASPAQPNLVFFLVDDMGWQETSVPFHTEVTALNRRYRTPHMERLAAEGMKFTQAYAYAVCSPSRVSALTGMNAARHGVTNWTLRRDVSPDQVHPAVEPPAWNLNGVSPVAGVPRAMHVTPLPTLLRAAGYRTIHVGKAHFGAQGTPGEDPRNLGFDVNIAGHAAGGPGSFWGEKNYSAVWRTPDPKHRIWDVPGLEKYHGTPTYLTEAITLEAVRAIENAHAEQKPFYLYLSHYAIHAPREKDDRFYQRYVDAGLKPADATLASMIEGMDKSLGDIMAALDRLRVADNTIILFLTDNGATSDAPRNLPLRGHKLSPYEGGPRVPMIVRWPGTVAAGSTCRTPLIIEDVFPSLLELAGVSWQGRTLQPVDGRSFVPLLKGAAPADSDRPFVWHFPHFYSRQTPFSSIRVGDWKLIYHHADRRMELFDLAADLSEQTDLAAGEPGRVRALADRLTAWLQSHGAQMPVDKRTGTGVPFPTPSN